MAFDKEKLSEYTLEQLVKFHAEKMARAKEIKEKEGATLAELAELREVAADLKLITDAHSTASVQIDLTDLSVEEITSTQQNDEAINQSVEEIKDEVKETESETKQEAVVANAGKVKLPEPVKTDVVVKKEPWMPAIVASAANEKYVTGNKMSYADLATSMKSMGDQLKNKSKNSGKIESAVVASVMQYEADDAMGFDPDENTRIMREANEIHRDLIGQGKDGVTAAACGPFDAYREIASCTCADRPVRSIFPRIPTASNAAISYVKSASIDDLAGGVTVWTDTNQQAVDPADPDTWKPCAKGTCAVVETAVVQAIPYCFSSDLLSTRTSPEQEASNLNVLMAAAARVAEGELLQTIDDEAGIQTFDGNGGLGLAWTIQDIISSWIGYIRSKTRCAGDWVAILDNGLYELAAGDLFARSSIATNDIPAELQAHFSTFGVTQLVRTNDWATNDVNPWASFIPTVGGVFPVRPNTFSLRLVDASQFAVLDSPEISFGLQVGPPNTRQNIREHFGELFEKLVNLGCDNSLSVKLTGCNSGLRAGTIIPDCVPVHARIAAPVADTKKVAK